MSEEKNPKGERQEEIKEMGSIASFDGKHKIYCLTIIGEIEGHNVLPEQNKTTKYEHVIPQLVAIEESEEMEGLLIILNTVGGDVEAGLAIAELISGMKKPTVSFVLGGGHSIGVPLAVSAKRSSKKRPYIIKAATAISNNVCKTKRNSIISSYRTFVRFLYYISEKVFCQAFFQKFFNIFS